MVNVLVRRMSYISFYQTSLFQSSDLDLWAFNSKKNDMERGVVED